jgi:hypothetical protein
MASSQMKKDADEQLKSVLKEAKALAVRCLALLRTDTALKRRLFMSVPTRS